MNEVLEKIQKIGIVPVVVLNDAKDAAPLAKALCDGGLPCAEVTFRTEAAEESIRMFGEAVVILNPDIDRDFRYMIKQNGAMLAKGWLLGIQFLGLFEN